MSGLSPASIEDSCLGLTGSSLLAAGVLEALLGSRLLIFRCFSSAFKISFPSAESTFDTCIRTVSRKGINIKEKHNKSRTYNTYGSGLFLLIYFQKNYVMALLSRKVRGLSKENLKLEHSCI